MGKRHLDQSGFMLVMVIILLLVITIAIPSLINWVRQETKDTVKVKRSSTAFHLAEAGADRGVWKLQESLVTWQAAKSTATPVTDYTGSTIFSFTFSNGKVGQYDVKFSTGPGTGQVTVLSKGLDPSTRELRAVQVVVEENGAGTFAI